MNHIKFLIPALLLALAAPHTTFAGSPDTDGDGIADEFDNCIEHANPDQADSDGDGYGNRCDPDLNGDLRVNFVDVSMMRRAFFATPTAPNWNPDADLNSDARVNFGDLSILVAFFFLAPGPSADVCVPQPAGLVRDDPRFAEPRPRVQLRRDIMEFQRADPDAVFSFFNCEIDSFATTPKDSIPGYAKAALAELGLPAVAEPLVLLLEPTAEPKPEGRDLDSPDHRVQMLPLLFEPTDPTPPPEDERFDEVENDPFPGEPIAFERTRPAEFLEPAPDDYTPPGAEEQERFSAAALPVLAGFLSEFGELFKLPRDPTTGRADLSSLTGMQYSEGRYYRRVLFEGQVLGELPVLDGRTLVQFDRNWNVINISRQLMTPAKLSIPPGSPITQEAAEGIALELLVSETGLPADDLSFYSSVLAKDVIRRLPVWELSAVAPEQPDIDFSVLLHAETGAVLNLSDNVSAYTDAKVRRWAYASGNLSSGAYQVTSSNIYTRDDNSLEHDFFYVLTDERGGGSIGQINCTATPKDTLWRPLAYNTTSSLFSFIRHTHRTARDFNVWSPAASSGSFNESHSYFWARKFMLWERPMLSHLGVLAASVSNYKRFTMIINSCSDDYYATSSLPVTSQHNLGESLYKIRIREECKSTNPNCAAGDYDEGGGSFVTCEGNGCAGTPSVIHHEINHFVMSQYFGIGSSLDCGSGKELKMLHEGMMGSVIPQAFWHHYYGVGFNPSNSRLFTKSQPRGRVHADIATRLDLSDWPCSSNTSGQGPYDAGRVPGQPMWEIYHGKRADGNSLVNILRPANDLTFLNLSYWAADLVAASTWKDRWEMANRWMQLSINNLSFASAAQKETLRDQWCETWEHHELGTYISFAYCP